MTPALETLNLSKRYGRGGWALQDCTLNVVPGSVTALVGPNGAGKTTLLHLAIGLIEATSGSLSVLGHSPSGSPTEILPDLGFVAQDRPLYGRFTVEETMRLGGALNPRWSDDVFRHYCSVGEVPFAQRVRTLSGGQKAQVALAMALAKQPRLLLLDEPVASLDPLARVQFLNGLTNAATQHGTTVVLSSHVVNDVETTCDHLILLSKSRVQLLGSIEELERTHFLVVGTPTDLPAIRSDGAFVSQRLLPSGETAVLMKGQSATGTGVRRASVEDIVLGYMTAAHVPEQGAISGLH